MVIRPAAWASDETLSFHYSRELKKWLRSAAVHHCYFNAIEFESEGTYLRFLSAIKR